MLYFKWLEVRKLYIKHEFILATMTADGGLREGIMFC